MCRGLQDTCITGDVQVGVIDPYHVSADTSRNLFSTGYCKVTPLPDSFVSMLHYCANLKAIKYESMSLNRIVADKSHRVIVA